MYLLSEYKYDYHEFEEPIAASRNIEALEKYARELSETEGMPLLYSKRDHADAYMTETEHLFITEILEV